MSGQDFRRQYYEKVGFRLVEGKRCLEPLLRDTPVDADKLRRFARRQLVPGVYRPLVWRLLLGVQPCHREASEFVTARRRETAADTLRCLRVLRLVNETSSPALICWLGWLLNSRRLVSMSHDQLLQQVSCPQLRVAELVADLFDDPTDQFFVSCRFWSLQLAALSGLEDHFVFMRRQLEREDPALYAHLMELTLLETVNDLPLYYWFSCLWCGVLSSGGVERLLDKLAAGGDRILPLTAVALLICYRKHLLAAQDPVKARAVLERSTEMDTDRITNLALELWAKLEKQ